LDQKVDKSRPNSGILPLPNLETKFIAANTLIGLEKPSNTLHLIYQHTATLERDLKLLRHRYFRIKTRREKEELQKKDQELRKQIANILKKHGWSVDEAEKIASFDPFDQNASADWFDPEWMFGVRDGFDIVIGNPPYIKEYTNRRAFDGLRNSPYYQGKMDIWYLFACKGIDFLKNKGILTFIAQNNWVTSYGASKMRNKVVKECKILQLLDFGPYFIFENSNIQTMIMIFQKNPEPIEYSFDLRRIIGEKPVYKDVIYLLNKIPNPNNEYLNPTINRNKFLNKPLTFSKTDVEAVLNKIEEKGKERLHENEITNGIHSHHDKVSKDMLKKLGQGFKVGDGIFVLSDEEKNNLQLTEKELELIKPYYTSKELKKYYAKRKNSEWIIYTDSRFKDPEAIKPYPNIKKHLDKFQAVITSDNKPYGLHRARDERFFKGEKIIALRKCVEPTFTYTDFDCYVSAAFYVIKTNRFNMKYLTGLLNSKLIAFWLKHKGKMQGNIYQIDKEPLLNIPIPPITPQNQPLADQIVQKVQEILTLTQSSDYETNQEKQQKVKELEKEIDQLVYKLYDLTEDEIAIIENN
jgi:adenine-specific DNA-methyltransferase